MALSVTKLVLRRKDAGESQKPGEEEQAWSLRQKSSRPKRRALVWQPLAIIKLTSRTNKQVRRQEGRAIFPIEEEELRGLRRFLSPQAMCNSLIRHRRKLRSLGTIRLNQAPSLLLGRDMKSVMMLSLMMASKLASG